MDFLREEKMFFLFFLSLVVCEGDSKLCFVSPGECVGVCLSVGKFFWLTRGVLCVWSGVRKGGGVSERTCRWTASR